MMTKQSVGEVTSDLEERGYVERVRTPRRPRQDHPADRPGPRGPAVGRQLIDELEREWAERFGEERVAALREALEVITADRVGVGVGAH